MQKHIQLIIAIIFFSTVKTFSQYCAYSSLASKPNMVINGDFEADNLGITSQYTWVPSTTLLYEEKYTFTTNANLVHFAWTGPSRTGTGKFMAINGAGTPLFFWSQTISVSPNKNYRFSTWLKNVVQKPQYQGLAPAQIELWINNQKVSNTITLVDYPDVWRLLDTVWNSGSSTSAILAIKTVSTAGNGCDFGMDDVEFKECSCTSTSLSASNTSIVCLGDSMQINANPGTTGGTYSWSPGFSLNDSTLKSPYAKPKNNTLYTVTYTLAGCSTTANVQVNVTQVSANAGLDKNICAGDSVQINASAVGTFSWLPVSYMSNPSLINPYVKPPSTTSYVLTSSQSGCTRADTVKINVASPSSVAGIDKVMCRGDSVRLDASAIGSFTWSPSNTLSDSTQIKPFAKPNTDTKYILTSRLGSCLQRDTVEVFVTQVLASAHRYQNVCLGDSVQLDATTLGTVLWQPSTFLDNPNLSKPYCKPSSNISYVLTCTNGSCVQRDTVHVQIYTSATASAGLDKRICAGTSVALNASSASTYEWSPAYYINSTNIQSPSVNPPIDTTYYLKITVGSCVGFDTVKVSVVPIPSVNLGDDQKLCLGDSLQLHAAVSSPSKWTWKSQTPLSDTSILTPKTKITKNETIIMVVSDTSGLCFSSDTLQVLPYPAVKALYGADNYNGEGQLKPTFDNTSQNASKYLWLFGDSLNSSAVDKNPDFTFIKPGVYKVKLVAKNDYGCSDSITKEFTVYPLGKLYIPNAFTPNGDLVNEVFKFVYPEAAYRKVEMTIYNRWGGFIYETSMPGGKWWDGTFEGAPVSEDVYFYVAKAIKINGDVADYHGTITLLR